MGVLLNWVAVCLSIIFKGYKNIMENCMENARALKEGIEKTGRFEIVSKDVGVPLVAFALKDSSTYSVFDISGSLRRFGWIIPAYTMPSDAEHVAVLRVVIREDFSRSLAERLVSHIEKVMKEMDSLPSRSVAHVTAEVDSSQEAGKRDEVVIKKGVRDTQEEITGYWKRLVDGKKTTGVC